MRIEKDGKAIVGLDDWPRPKVGYQWADGHSAKEFARAWCRSNPPAMPAEIAMLLEAHDATKGFLPDVGRPEHRIPFDTYGGEPRNADMALVGHTPPGKVAITIEAKADESFGETVSDALDAALERGITNPASNGVRRVEGLVRALFGPKTNGESKVIDLRYQLLTAVAGSVAFAIAEEAPTAVLIVHEFVTDETTNSKHEANARDLDAFLQRFANQSLPDGPCLIGPLPIPGGSLFPKGKSLFIGKVTTNLRKSAQARTKDQSTRRFERYIGIDYSGAKVPTASLKGLRVYCADKSGPPEEVGPPQSLKRYWTRKDIAHWLRERLSEDVPTVVGIDHGFSFPLAYFDKYDLPHDWPAFLDDFRAHWPTDEDHTYVDFVRDGAAGNGSARMGNTRWKRVTETRAGSAKSLFHFDVQGSVAKSTHSGLPWLKYLRDNVSRPLHFWPFEGWEIPPRTSAVVEVYPRLWNRQIPKPEGRTDDQHDAWVVAEWLRRADADGRLNSALRPNLDGPDRKATEIEGWILGVN